MGQVARSAHQNLIDGGLYHNRVFGGGKVLWGRANAFGEYRFKNCQKTSLRVRMYSSDVLAAKQSP